MATYPVKMLKDKDGTLFVPLVNSDAIIMNGSDTLQDLLDEKQDTLVSGTNIKTINNTSLLGSGNITISGGGTATDVQVNGTSIVSSNTANIRTNGTYNSSTNKIATMSDVPSATSDLTNDSNFVADSSYVHTDNNFTTTLKNKLDGIAAGAEVNVNADWNASSGDAKILNKPTIPTKVSDLTNDSGFTTNTGTVTSVAVKMNNTTKGTVTTSGTIDLGTVITAHQDISGKVDKVNGKGLSTNDYTTADMNKLAGIEAGAEVNQYAFSGVEIGRTVISAWDVNSTLGIVKGDNITLTPHSDEGWFEISATDTTYSSKTASSGGTDVSLVTTGEKYTWNNKQNALSSQTAYSAKGTSTKVPQITTNSLGQVTGITEVTITHQDISGKENTSNKVTSISSSSTNTQYPSALAVYNYINSLNGNGVSY